MSAHPHAEPLRKLHSGKRPQPRGVAQTDPQQTAGVRRPVTTWPAPDNRFQAGWGELGEGWAEGPARRAAQRPSGDPRQPAYSRGGSGSRERASLSENPRYPAIISSADGWDLTVPEDAAELLAELRRHGVRPGQRLHVVRADEEPKQSSGEDASRPPRAKLDFIGSVHGGPADLSIRTDEYLQRGFGRE